MNISASQLSSNGDSQGVKTHVRIALFNADSFEEIKPSFLGAFWADVGLRYSTIKHFPEKRDQLVMEPGYVCFAALCSERDAAILDIDIAHRVQIGFGEAATLVTGYREAHPKEGFNARVYDLADALRDVSEVVFVKRRFDATGGALQTKLAAWVGGSVSAKNRLFHYKPESFDFEKRGVMARAIFTNPSIWEFSPVKVPMAILPPESAGDEDAGLIEEHLNCAPCAGVSLGTLRLVGVAFVDEVWNPSWPALRGYDASAAALVESSFISQLPGSASVGADAVPQSSGLPSDLPRDGSELNPPVGASCAFVDRGQVSPSVTAK